MEIDAVNKLVFQIIEQVAAKNCDLNKVIEFVVSFSNEHSFSPDIFLDLATIFGRDKMYREKYVVTKACSLLFSGEVRQISLMQAGKTASLLGFKELAVQEFEALLKENPQSLEALSEYGNVLVKMEKLDAARIQYEKALKINPNHADALSNYGCLLAHA